MSLFNLIKLFQKSQSGQISVIMSLALLPLLGAVGLGLDYSYLAREKTKLQVEADTEALQSRSGAWISSNVYEVTKTKTVKTFFSGILGVKNTDITVVAQAYSKRPQYTFSPPTFMNYSASAQDYGVLGFYCYNPETSQRSNFSDFADNRGHSFNITTPYCESGESLHYFLRTYAHYTVKHYPSGYSYATITTMNAPCSSKADSNCSENLFLTVSGSKSPYTTPRNFNADVETIICSQLSQCLRPGCETNSINCLNYTWRGGLIPTGNMRSPTQQAQSQCPEGKYVYFGWEDTNAESGVMFKGDRDYNDAVLIVKCPERSIIPGKTVYLRQ